MAEARLDEPVFCRDTECGGIAEPESDGETDWYACTECGFEFGYQRVPQPDAGVCSLGVSPQARRMSPGNGSGPVLMQIGRRPE